MKKFTYLALSALGILAIASCKKPVIDMTAQNNNNSANSVGNNSNSSNNSSNFNWSGTAPLSVKLNGVDYICDPSLSSVFETPGKYQLHFNDGHDKILDLFVNVDSEPGYVGNIVVRYKIPNDGLLWMEKSGQYKIITNDATVIEGYFYADLKDMETGVYKGTLTEGYFKMNKE